MWTCTIYVGVGKLYVTGLFRFGRQIVWNWTVNLWGANCVEMYCIGLGGTNVLNRNI
jgi:hypothetical protein